jgi:CIC family chloride channel protein
VYPPWYPTAVVMTPGISQKIRSAPQKHPIATNTVSEPVGWGPSIDESFTKWTPEIVTGSERPERALSAVGMAEVLRLNIDRKRIAPSVCSRRPYVMGDRYRTFVSSAFDRARSSLRNRGTTSFLIAAVALGALVGVATAGLAVLIDAVETLADAFADWSAWGVWAFAVLIPIGMSASWWLNHRWGPGISGGGVTETMTGLSLHGGYLPTRLIVPKLAATAATLGTGGSGGAEGPIAYIGGSLGSSLARYTNFDHDRIRSLVAAGAGAGIGASFNAPIAGMLFAMEVILGSFAIRHLNAVVIASVVAAVTTQLLVGEELLLTSPAQRAGEPVELLLYVVLAAIAVGVGLIYLRTLDISSGATFPRRLPGWTKPLILGLSVALIGVVWPESLGTGRDFLQGLLLLEDKGAYVWWTLALIALAKIFTSAITRSGGGSAGTFMPALVIGGSMGAAFAILVQQISGFDELDTGAYVVVGMAAVFATTARAPLTSVIIVFELTGNYELILPLMLAAALATFFGDRFHPDTAYTISLRQQGIQLPTNEDIDLLDTVDVRDVMKDVDGVLHPWQTLADAAEFFDLSSHHGAPVVNDRNELVGVLSLSDIVSAGGPSHATTIADAMSRDPITITPDAPVSMALARMASMGVGRLPVLGGDNQKTVVGMFRRESVVNAYELGLSMAKGRELYREQKRIRSQPGADFFVVKIEAGSPVANLQIADIQWPSDAVLVSIQRSTAVLVPHGDTVIRVGDVLTAFGSPDSRTDIAAAVTTTSDIE